MSMTATEAKTAIKNKLAEVLPALLTAAGLEDFADYLDEQPSKTDQRQIGIYIDIETDTTDYHRLALIIQAQIYGKPDWKQSYHSVIMAAIRRYITADLVGFTDRDSIEADLWPVDKNNTSFGYYTVTFSEPLDDSDY